MVEPYEDQANFNIENTGYLMPYQIDDIKFASMRNLHLQKVSEILIKENRTEFENLLLDSIEFFGSGMIESTTKNTFTKFIMSLEILLLKKKENKSLLSERVALIIGEELENRQELFLIVNQMYNIRSDIVHGGPSNVTFDDVNYLGSLVCQLIIKSISLVDSIRSKESLISIINKMKLGSKESFDKLAQNS